MPFWMKLYGCRTDITVTLQIMNNPIQDAYGATEIFDFVVAPMQGVPKNNSYMTTGDHCTKSHTITDYFT